MSRSTRECLSRVISYFLRLNSSRPVSLSVCMSVSHSPPLSLSLQAVVKGKGKQFDPRCGMQTWTHVSQKERKNNFGTHNGPTATSHEDGIDSLEPVPWAPGARGAWHSLRSPVCVQRRHPAGDKIISGRATTFHMRLVTVETVFVIEAGWSTKTRRAKNGWSSFRFTPPSPPSRVVLQLQQSEAGLLEALLSVAGVNGKPLIRYGSAYKAA